MRSGLFSVDNVKDFDNLADFLAAQDGCIDPDAGLDAANAKKVFGTDSNVSVMVKGQNRLQYQRRALHSILLPSPLGVTYGYDRDTCLCMLVWYELFSNCLGCLVPPFAAIRGSRDQLPVVSATDVQCSVERLIAVRETAVAGQDVAIHKRTISFTLLSNPHW